VQSPGYDFTLKILENVYRVNVFQNIIDKPDFVKRFDGEVLYPSLSCAVVFVQTKLQGCSLAGTGQVKRLCWLLGTSVQEIGWCVRLSEPPCRSMWEVSTINKVHSARTFWQGAYFHEGEVQFVLSVFTSIKQPVCISFHGLQERFSRWIKLLTTSLLLGTLADLTRGKSELLAENALLRHQLSILRRQIKRPVYRKSDRFLLVVLARMVRTWKQALFLVQPETDLALAS
jgi:hypothetical protein